MHPYTCADDKVKTGAEADPMRVFSYSGCFRMPISIPWTYVVDLRWRSSGKRTPGVRDSAGFMVEQAFNMPEWSYCRPEGYYWQTYWTCPKWSCYPATNWSVMQAVIHPSCYATVTALSTLSSSRFFAWLYRVANTEHREMDVLYTAEHWIASIVYVISAKMKFQSSLVFH